MGLTLPGLPHQAHSAALPRCLSVADDVAGNGGGCRVESITWQQGVVSLGANITGGNNVPAFHLAPGAQRAALVTDPAVSLEPSPAAARHQRGQRGWRKTKRLGVDGQIISHVARAPSTSPHSSTHTDSARLTPRNTRLAG